MADKRKTAVPGQDLILLFGMLRSGTTWLGKLFDSHPDTLYRHEPDTWQRSARPRYTTRQDSSYYSVFRDPMVSAMRWKNEPAPKTIARVMTVVKQRPFKATYGNTGNARTCAS